MTTEESERNTGRISFAPLVRELAACLDEALGSIERAHYRCDEVSDLECRAEEYGDGEAADHALLREGRALIAEANDALAPPQPRKREEEEDA